VEIVGVYLCAALFYGRIFMGWTVDCTGLTGLGQRWAGSLLLLGLGQTAIAPAVAAEIPVTVDWSQVTGQATAQSYGINVFQGFRPEIVTNPSYQQGMRSLSPGMLRYHNMRMLDDSTTRSEGWVSQPTTANYAWDRPKIARSLVGAYPGVSADRMLNIPGFPAYMRDSTGRLKPQFYAAYANFCADLVRVVNQELGQSVRYWEVTNELDANAYASDTPGQGMDEVGKIYVQAAQAMRSVDPSIQIGGPGQANPYNTSRLTAFVNQAYGQLDFISVHSYSSFQAFDPVADANNQGIWQSAENRANVTSPVRQVLSQASQRLGARNIALFHGEFNLSGSYQLNDPRMRDERGMIYDALAFAAIANSGMTGAMAWNEADGIYGKLAPTSDGNWQARPAVPVFNLYNRYFRGSIVKTSAPPRVLDTGKVARGEIVPNAVTTFAVASPQSQSLALINRSGQAQTVRILWGEAAAADTYAVSKTGVVQQRLTLAANGTTQVIPRDTVLFVVQNR
jgi:Glycosyl hydrolases family 39